MSELDRLRRQASLQQAMKELAFQSGIKGTQWYKEFNDKFGESPNLDDPNYNYRAAWEAGARPTVRDPGDNLLHWSSEFKGPNHPNRFVNGVDTTITQHPQNDYTVGDE